MHKVNIYLEYFSVYTLVRIGTTHPLSCKWGSPPEPKGGTHSPAGEGVGGVPIRSTGDTVKPVYSVLLCILSLNNTMTIALQVAGLHGSFYNSPDPDS